MTAHNSPQAGDTVVPSAYAERRRIWQSDAFGVIIYAAVAGAFALVALIIVGVAR